MEFLKTAALHTPPEHYHLLLFMMNLLFIMLVPFLGLLLGFSVLSYFYNRRGRTGGKEADLKFGQLLIDVGFATKSLVVFLAVIPALSLVFLMAQLLQETPAIAATLMSFGFLSLLIAAVLLYAYKVSYRFVGLLRSYDGLLRQSKPGKSVEINDLATYRRVNERTHLRSGLAGILFLVVASFLTVGAITIAGDPEAWSSVDSLFDLLLYVPFWFRFLQFLAISAGATGVGILFFFFSWNQGGLRREPEVSVIARRDGLRLAFSSILLQPVLLLVTVATLPSVSLSGTVFGLSGLALVFFFVCAHFVYAFTKEARPGYAAYAFYTLAVALILLSTRDQLAISNATRDHAVRLAVAAERETDELKSKLGVVIVNALSGQEIYDAKCSACHLFDARKVGPAYKDVIPKYEGKKAQLMAFILSPVKVDPAFPSMPNQGLRRADADSIASFLLAKFFAKRPVPQAATK